MSDKNPKTYTLIGADGKSYESETKGTLGGRRKDKIYGTLGCKGAARWIAKGFYNFFLSNLPDSGLKS